MGFSYWLWKRRVKKIPSEKCRTCCVCDQPIYPDEFVGQTTEDLLVHAGFHNSLVKENDFCETAAVGSGYWNGTSVDPVESAFSASLRTGKAVERTIGPDGIQDRLLR